MEWLFIFGLAGALAFVWQRLALAERRLAALDEALDRLATSANRSAEERAAPSLVAPPEQAAPSRHVTVPSVALTRLPEPALSAPPPDAPLPEPQPAQASEPERRLHLPQLDLEDIFGRRLPIWAGGVALAVAGVFLVRYSIERGLITPTLRVVMAFLFGLALLGGAEAAYRWRERVRDPRVAQALAGAGLATLYAGFYLAGAQYGLVGQTLAFLGLAGVTAAAIALSFRFGLPSAVLGLLGGFAAPALVGGDAANVPLLALYLGLVTAGLTVAGRRQERPWMGAAALAGGLGWGALLLLSGDFGVVDLAALGLYLVVLGAVLPALAGSRLYERHLRLGAALVASVQLAVLVDQGGYSALVWALYLLLGGTLAWFGWRRADVREASAAAAVVGVVLLAQWTAPPPALFALVVAALAALFAGMPLALALRGAERKLDLYLLALVPAALAIVAYATFGDFAADRVELPLALAALALGAFPAAGAWAMRSRDDQRWFATLCASTAALAFAALLLMTPGWAAPLAAAAVLAVPLWLLHKQNSEPLANVLWGGVAVTLLALVVTPHAADEIGRLGGAAAESPAWRGVLRWLTAIVPALALAMLERRAVGRQTAEALAALLAYGALAQFIPAPALAWAAALGALGLWAARRDRTAAQAMLVVIALAWSLVPLGQWLGATLLSLVGEPVFVTELPKWSDALSRILPVGVALAVVGARTAVPGYARLSFRLLAAPFLIVAAHVLFKQAFALDSASRFVTLGMAERTLWEALLLAGAWTLATGLPRLGAQRLAASVLAAAALTHFALYTLLLHNPLWAAQAVGSIPLVNLVTLAYAVAIATALSLRRWLGERWRVGLDAAAMLLAACAALTLLRQAFGGTIPAQAPMGQTEDLLRSLLGILLALLFLWIGSWRGERSWRVGSLVLMLIAVAKVFLLDAAGLAGLLRIASFMALGFSLIGIGWIYARQLRALPPSPADVTS